MIHSSLDMIDELEWQSNQLYLKVVDNVSKYFISTYVTPGCKTVFFLISKKVIKFCLLHENKSEEGIKQFFQEIHELYIKIQLNPFYEPNSEIQNVYFKEKVLSLASKFLK
jgi:trafficking protein particle complex subunit 2